MISLKIAKELKEAGFKWQPQEGDKFYYAGYENHPECEAVSITFISRLSDYELKFRGRWGSGYSEVVMDRTVEDVKKDINNLIDRHFFAPRLDQLLIEIEKRSWKWQLRALTMSEYCVQLRASNILNGLIWGDGLYANSPEDAVALGLIWILKNNIISK